MAIKDTRGGREYDKFLADSSGETGIRVITGAHETISATATASITSTATPGAAVLTAQDITGKQRIGLQFQQDHGSVTATFKVWASLVTSPGTPIANTLNWTQIGDDVTVTAAADNAYKAIATTPMKWLFVTAHFASTATGNCTAYMMAD